MDNIEDFNEFMDYYKGLSLKEKKEMVIQELKLLAASTNKACESLGVNNEILVNSDLLDIKQNDNEEDYIEALMVYICSIKNSFCDLIDGLNSITEE